MSTKESGGSRTTLTSAFVTAQDSSTEKLPIRVNGLADFLGVSTCAHSINMHFILGRHTAEEVKPSWTSVPHKLV
jgi:hypothetical protein